MTLDELDHLIADHDKIIPGCFDAAGDAVTHWVVFASNQTFARYPESPDQTFCGFSSYYGPRRGAAITCMACVRVHDELYKQER